MLDIIATWLIVTGVRLILVSIRATDGLLLLVRVIIRRIVAEAHGYEHAEQVDGRRKDQNYDYDIQTFRCVTIVGLVIRIVLLLLRLLVPLKPILELLNRVL